MIALMLCMMVTGIGIAQAIMDPNHVTLRWLRLGGILALLLLVIVATVHVFDRSENGRFVTWIGLACTGLFFSVQLITVQVALHRVQRMAALAAFAAGSWWAALGLKRIVVGADPMDLTGWAEVALTGLLSSVLLGGFLMAMLLGHAYLTAGTEMTQRPFKRLVGMLAIAMMLRACVSIILGLLPYWTGSAGDTMQVWTVTMIIARYAVGLIVPGVFTYMVYDCVRRAANQSATGILYVTLVLVILGEGANLALLDATGLFF